MINLTNEVKATLLQAKNAGEVASVLKGAGEDEALAERLWDELTRRHEEDGRNLSLDELEAVSGGADRDWARDGCANTVTPTSWCWSNDGCIRLSVVYENEPVSEKCPVCGTYLYIYSTYPKDVVTTYKCRNCGYTKRTEE